MQAMVLPASHDAEKATEKFPDSTVISTFQSLEEDNDDRYDFTPPSPEIGMAREGGGEVSGLDLEEEDNEGVADIEQPETTSNMFEQHGDGAASTTDNEDQLANLPRLRQTQQPQAENTQRASSELTDGQLTPICPPTRRSARLKSALAYDQKYHPIDDFIRPSQAAKCRASHGESPTLGNDSYDQASEDSVSDVKIMVDDKDNDEEESQALTRGRKRKRSRSPSREPTRRSSRKRTKPKVSYNMKVHPQDSDLQRVWACDGSNSSPSPLKQVSLHKTDYLRKKGSLEDFKGACQSLLTGWPEEFSPEPSPEPSSKPSRRPSTQQTSGMEPATKQATKLDSYPDLRPDVACRMSNQGSWPDMKGLPFCIYTECIEDQLNAEAEAASPLHYEDDEKENNVTNPELVPGPNPLDGISIIPASNYRRSSGLHAIPAPSSITNNPFYMHPQFEVPPYGLGSSDGTHDMNSSDTQDCPIPDYMHILASGENLPRASTPRETHSYGNDAAVSSSPVRALEHMDLRR